MAAGDSIAEVETDKARGLLPPSIITELCFQEHSPGLQEPGNMGAQSCMHVLLKSNSW